MLRDMAIENEEKFGKLQNKNVAVSGCGWKD